MSRAFSLVVGSCVLLIEWSAPAGACAQPDRCVLPEAAAAIPTSTAFTMYRPGQFGVHPYYRDLEFAWDSAYVAMSGAVQHTLRNWAQTLVTSTGISPLAPEARGLQTVHDYFRREGIDWTPVLTQRPIRMGLTSEIAGYTDEDRGHVDVYITHPNRLYWLNGELRNFGGARPSGWIAPDEDVTSGYAAGTTRPANSLSLDGPPIGTEIDTLGTGWTQPRTYYQQNFHHEFQHGLPPHQGGGIAVTSELWSAAAEVVGGHFELTTPREFPYNFPLLDNYQARTAFMAYVAYNFRNADTTRSLTGLTDDVLYNWAKSRTQSQPGGIARLGDFLSDAECATCASKQYFRPAGLPLDNYDRPGVLLHNWRVAMFANNPVVGEQQYGYPAWAGFTPRANVRAWQSFAGTYDDDVDALPSIVTLTSANLTSEVSIKHVRTLHGGNRPLAVSQYGANYWVIRAGSGLTSTDRKLAVRITPMSALRLNYLASLTGGGRLHVSMIEYSHVDTTAAEESILWQHPEWVTVVTPIASVDVDTVTSEVEVIIPAFGATTKAAVLVMSISDGRTRFWGDQFTDFTTNAFQYRLDIGLRSSEAPQVAARLFSPVDSLRLSPVWSPDGNAVVYTARESSGKARLWRQAISGSSPVALNAQNLDQLYPDWSPRGDVVAYAATPDLNLTADSDLYLTPASPVGSAPNRLTSLAGYEAFPAFQPNGQGLAYLHFNGTSWQLRWIAIDGTGDMLLTDLGEISTASPTPRWNSDGSRVYFLHKASGDRIAWVPRQGGTPTIASEFDIVVRGFDLHPGIGPLVVSTAAPLKVTTPSTEPPITPGRLALYTSGASADTAFRLNSLGYSMDAPRYSRDGTRVAAHGKRIGGQHALFWGRITDNLAPQFNTIEDQFGVACVPLQFGLPATDPEGQPLTWQAYYKPPGSALIQNNVFRWQIPVVGDYYTVFRVMDVRGAVDIRVVRITISDQGMCEDPLSGGGEGGGGFRAAETHSSARAVERSIASSSTQRNSFLDGALEGEWATQVASLPALSASANGEHVISLRSGATVGADLDRIAMVAIDHDEATVAAAGPGGLLLGRSNAPATLQQIAASGAVDLAGATSLMEAGDIVEATFAPAHDARGMVIRCQQAGNSAGAGIEVLARDGDLWNVVGRIHPRRAMDRIALHGVLQEAVRLRFTGPTLLAGVERVLWSPADQIQFITHEVDPSALDDAPAPLTLRVTDGEHAHIDPGSPRRLTFTLPEPVAGLTRDLFLSVTARVPDLSSLRESADDASSAPSTTSPEFALGRVEPNPVVGRAMLSFTLAEAAAASLDVFDIQGAHVRTLAHGEHAAGAHRLAWDGRDSKGARVRAGTYFIRLESAGRTARSRFVLIQ